MNNSFDKFLERMKGILGDEYKDFESSLSLPLQKAIYVNNNKISKQDFEKTADFAIEPIRYEPNGFYIDNEKYGRHALHHAGAFYMQEPSAMFTVNAYNFSGCEKVLDMCASPGGKSIQIANRIPQGVLVSNEFNRARSEVLFSNIERMGLRNVIVTNDSSENLAKSFQNTFDVCLVDAPCSGEGMFRRGNAVVEEWNENLPKMCAERQMEILNNADKCLKKGGIIIYSTCTYSVEENEDVVREFLSNHDYSLIKVEEDFSRGVDMTEVVRLYPHKNRGEGQFVAVMKKNFEQEGLHFSNIKLESDRLAKEFAKKTTNLGEEDINNIYSYNNHVYFIPDKSLIRRGVNYVSLGVRLGAVKNSRFEPHHNFFTAFGNWFKIKLKLDHDSEDIKNYLRGDTLSTDLEDGYGAIFASGCALGGFKVSQGKFKNHYPKGLRNFS